MHVWKYEQGKYFCYQGNSKWILWWMNLNSFGNKRFCKEILLCIIDKFAKHYQHIIKVTDQLCVLEHDLFSFDMTWIADTPQRPAHIFCILFIHPTAIAIYSEFDWFTPSPYSHIPFLYFVDSALAIYFLSCQTPSHSFTGPADFWSNASFISDRSAHLS